MALLVKLSISQVIYVDCPVARARLRHARATELGAHRLVSARQALALAPAPGARK